MQDTGELPKQQPPRQDTNSPGGHLPSEQIAGPVSRAAAMPQKILSYKVAFTFASHNIIFLQSFFLSPIDFFREIVYNMF